MLDNAVKFFYWGRVASLGLITALSCSTTKSTVSIFQVQVFHAHPWVLLPDIYHALLLQSSCLTLSAIRQIFYCLAYALQFRTTFSTSPPASLSTLTIPHPPSPISILLRPPNISSHTQLPYHTIVPGCEPENQRPGRYMGMMENAALTFTWILLQSRTHLNIKQINND